MDLNDRWEAGPGVRPGEVVAGEVTHAEWLLERTHAKYLPLVKAGCGALFARVDEATWARAEARKARAAEVAAAPAAARLARERALLRRSMLKGPSLEQQS